MSASGVCGYECLDHDIGTQSRRDEDQSVVKQTDERVEILAILFIVDGLTMACLVMF
jgi:hypothetical protein